MGTMTEETVLSRTRAKSLDRVRNLNCWGLELENVSLLERMPNLEVLNLSVNKIASLEAFSSCLKLRELYFRGNAICDLSQLQHLAKLINLQVLWLQDNPCCSESNYRSTVLQLLPNLRRLDNIGVVSAERFGSTTETDGGEAGDLTRDTDLKGDESRVLKAVFLLLDELDSDDLKKVQQKVSRKLKSITST